MKNEDINIDIDDYLLNVRAVAVMRKNNKVLFQKRKNDEFWALPGGKIRVGEKAENTISRELKEELDISKFNVLNCNSVSEYFFRFNDHKIHQYIFSFLVKVDSSEWIMNQKNEFNGVEKNENLVFKWFDLKSIEKAPVKPDFLKSQLQSINNKKTVFTSYIEKK